MKKTEKNSSRIKLFIIWTSMSIFIVLIYLILACEKEGQFPSVTMADLQGVWTTEAQGYEGRFLQFADETITFGWGDAGVGSYKIEEIHSTPGKFGTSVRIRYSGMDNTEYEFGFNYLRRGDGLIRMKNAKDADWERIGTQAIHTPDFR